MLAGPSKATTRSPSACAERSSLGRQWNPQVRLRFDTSASLRAPLARCSSGIRLKLGVIVHRCLQGNAPLMDCCKSTTDVASCQRLHSASRHQLIVPICHPTKFGRRAFFAGPTAWNSLPDLCDTSLSEDTFRRSLKTYLFALY